MKEKLLWNPSKVFRRNNQWLKITARISLDDDCNNMCYDFSITGEIWKCNKEGGIYGRDCEAGGCIHEDIVRHFPDIKKFVPLHLCNYLGQPMYPESNGKYHLKNSSRDVAMEYLRITKSEYDVLLNACNDDDAYFKYLLYSLGIVDRWKKEADEFIAFLEQKTGKKFVNPYKPEEERFRLKMTDEEKSEIEERIRNNYYTVEALKQRQDKRIEDARVKRRNEIIKECDKTIEKATRERDVMLYLFDIGMPIDNVIYYNHTNKCVFNWKSYEKKITQEEFVDFLSKVDHTKLPKGIEFELLTEPKY